jgi:hypothetical protein
MKQGCGVDKFDDGGELNSSVIDLFQRFGREECQQGPKSLTSSINNVMANVFDQLDVRLELIDDQLVNAFKIVRHTGSDGLYHWGPPKSARSIVG